MPLTTSSTTSASGTSPRDCRAIACGKTVERPPTRWIVSVADLLAAGARPRSRRRSASRGGPTPASARPGRTGWCRSRRPADASSRDRSARARAAARRRDPLPFVGERDRGSVVSCRDGGHEREPHPGGQAQAGDRLVRGTATSGTQFPRLPRRAGPRETPARRLGLRSSTTSCWTCAEQSGCSWPCATSGRTPTSSRRSTTRTGPRAASRTATIHTSFLQRLSPPRAPSARCCRCIPSAIESFDLSQYDLVVSSSSAWAHAVICDERTIHVSYCHNPFRYAWNDRERALAERPDPISARDAARAVPPLAPVGLDRRPARRPLRRELARHPGAGSPPTSAASRTSSTRRSTPAASAPAPSPTTTWCCPS